MVSIFTFLCHIVLLAEGAVLDKVAFTATLEASFVFDSIYGATEYEVWLRAYPEV